MTVVLAIGYLNTCQVEIESIDLVTKLEVDTLWLLENKD